MPPPKATSHGFGGSGGADGVTFKSAENAGVANATAATANKIIFLICCPPSRLLLLVCATFSTSVPAAGRVQLTRFVQANPGETVIRCLNVGHCTYRSAVFR